MSTDAMTEKRRPAFLRLPMTFDAERLKHDLRIAHSFSWRAEEPFGFKDFVGSDVTIFHDGQWKGLSLWAQGGDWQRTDPGGPGLEPFAETEILRRTPYFRKVVDSFRCFKRGVRLSLLPPGVKIEEHCDTYHDFRYGQIRLHIPVVTHPEVLFVIDGERCEWKEGELWYGDFSRPHYVENNSPISRIHIIIDVAIDDFVLSLFPDDFTAQLKEADVVMHEEPITLPTAGLEKLQCSFVIPAGLMKGIFEMDDGIPGQFEAHIRLVNGELVLIVGERPLLSLYPVSPSRFCFVGWVSERYLEFTTTDGIVSGLHLVIRHGHTATRVQLALEA